MAPRVATSAGLTAPLVAARLLSRHGETAWYGAQRGEIAMPDVYATVTDFDASMQQRLITAKRCSDVGGLSE